MRTPAWRSLIRLLALVVLCAGLGSGLAAPRQSAHADAGLSLQVLNGRTGLLRISGHGLPIRTDLYLFFFGATLAAPSYVVGYFTVFTSDTGSFDLTYPLAVFLCGTSLRMQVNDNDHTLLETPAVLVQCPSTAPAISVTPGSQSLQVAGTGFNIQETAVITASTTIDVGTTAVVTTTVVTDNSGAFLATLPFSILTCGNTATVTVVGGAGSMATAGPISNPCVAPISPLGTTPGIASGGSASQGSATKPSVHAQQQAAAARPSLMVESSPPTLGFGQIETMRIRTGPPGASVMVRLMALGMSLGSTALRTDAHGTASLSYRAPMHLKVGQRIEVTYSVSYVANGNTLVRTGSFSVVGS